MSFMPHPRDSLESSKCYRIKLSYGDLDTVIDKLLLNYSQLLSLSGVIDLNFLKDHLGIDIIKEKDKNPVVLYMEAKDDNSTIIEEF